MCHACPAAAPVGPAASTCSTIVKLRSFVKSVPISWLMHRRTRQTASINTIYGTVNRERKILLVYGTIYASHTLERLELPFQRRRWWAWALPYIHCIHTCEVPSVYRLLSQCPDRAVESLVWTTAGRYRITNSPSQSNYTDMENNLSIMLEMAMSFFFLLEINCFNKNWRTIYLIWTI